MTKPPGWYDDDHGALRWWDGSTWTEHVAESGDVEAPDTAHQGGYPAGYPGGGGAFIAATEPRKSRLWVAWVVIGILVLLLVFVFAILVPLSLMASPSAGDDLSAGRQEACSATV